MGGRRDGAKLNAAAFPSLSDAVVAPKNARTVAALPGLGAGGVPMKRSSGVPGVGGVAGALGARARWRRRRGGVRGEGGGATWRTDDGVLGGAYEAEWSGVGGVRDEAVA
eukprot:TRINITY_DN18972_c0_g1_i1.p4 TRINITY_DN18972_c0_g1~~TRINITY_DN18972_c0_g1_i1.p4  ORF type:complete len:110 (-),score=34.67 TRINITY_DN18972_c0_g1_i1:220-549(-)